MSPRYFTVVASPIGDLMLVSDGAALSGLHMLPHPNPTEHGWIADEMRFAAAKQQLAEYFAGERTIFDLPLAPEGTQFQQKVWQALREIPYGQTESYGQLAQRIGQPKASRAVGAANGRNPIAVIVPCHRVIGANGSLTGFGGGLDRKRWLLGHEAGSADARQSGENSADQLSALSRSEPVDSRFDASNANDCGPAGCSAELQPAAVAGE